jgi:Fe-S cluster biosynthesis and repair protein YggX
MTHMVRCARLGKELPGLEYQPMQGELGRRIYDQVSLEAWKEWLRHSVMLINEYRLNPAEPEARAALREQMERFFFGEGSAPPPDYVPEQE